MNGLETHLPVTNVARDTSFMLLSRFIISSLMSSGKGFCGKGSSGGFPGSKILPTDFNPLYLVGLNSAGNSYFRSEF